ncbi:RDD family protein [Leifsonia sp. NPDC058230]|uniref:RDD family protein n=1 Tax=Leifsonia sp. NPDC058230 TaxID=3346391 RepID=UPI0036DB1BE2
MTRHPWNRLLAWLVDWACILGWAAVTAAVGVPLYLSGATRGIDALTVNLVSAVVLVVPVTLALAWLESSRRQASVGKRLRRLLVTDARSGSRIPFGRALLRNALKLALPWSIGHAAVIEIVGVDPAAQVPAGVWVLTAVAYLLPIWYIVSLFVGSGRTPYDRLARTRVELG